MTSQSGEWAYSPDHVQICRIVETQTLWGETICRVWLPATAAVVRLPLSRLRPLSEAGTSSVEGLCYVATAAKVADALAHGVLLAPIGASVIPLPHQIRALSRAISSERVRYLLADEVGLGKTIEAGLILRELKLRGLVKRTLVVAPKGLVTQWVSEMRSHFGEHFRLIVPGDLAAHRRLSEEDNVWVRYPQVVCPMDSVKPLDGRRGWTRVEVERYNRERFEDLISAGWDLVIVDEAHRLAGSTDEVARYKLGQGLADAVPYMLLLSATPHQGKSDAFHRLVSMLDRLAFPDASSVTRERVAPYVIRTEKRHAIDAGGNPLFKPRRTQLVPVSWGDKHRRQQLLYHAVTEYVREGYNQAMREKRAAIGFLMLLMQRLVVSSTRAVATTLARRLEALESPQEQLTFFSTMLEEDWADLDGQEQLDNLFKTRLAALKNERDEVELLLDAAISCDRHGADAKAEALLDWIYRLQAEEGDPDLKILIFTEFVPTQEMLREFLTERGFKVVCLNGSMDMDERKQVQDAFAGEARFLISTDAGGEGLNLQVCHVVINYDVPWNPMRLEQRIGRVDRIGQTHVVRAINFILEDSVEYRVLQVLEEKLAVIMAEFGVDKTGDVLDSAQAGQIFDDLYASAILDPDSVETKVSEVVETIRQEAREARESANMLGSGRDLDPTVAQSLLAHPLAHWVECMTVNYLKAFGGKAEKKRAWNLTWPDGKTMAARCLTLEDPRVRDLVIRVPRFVPGLPVMVIALPGLPPEIRGIWGLWQISISPDDLRHRRIMPLFLSDDGRTFSVTARHVWDGLLAGEPLILGHLDAGASEQALARTREVAEQHGRPIYEELAQSYRDHLARVREKGEYAFAARRKTIGLSGLPQVRNHRLAQLEREELQFREDLEQKAEILPEMTPLVLVRVEGGTHE